MPPSIRFHLRVAALTLACAAPAWTQEPSPALPDDPALDPSPEERESSESDAAPAPSPWPLQVSTSTFSRFEYRGGYERMGVSRARFVEGDVTVYRARLGLRSNPLPVSDGVTALVQFSPQVSGQYGTTGTVTEQDVGLYEGYIRVESAMLSLEVGRFMMNYGDSMIIGNLDWHQAGRAFEGIRSRLSLDNGWVDFFVTQTLRPIPLVGQSVAEGHPIYRDPLFAGDTYFWGAYSALGGYLGEQVDFDVYALGLSTAKTRGVARDPADPDAGTFTRASATEVTLGARIKDQLTEVVDYRLEAGLQTGHRPNPADAGDTARSVFAYHADGEVGARFIGPLRLAVGGQIASGDDPGTDKDEGWNELYPTGHKFLGLMDIVGARTNVWSVVGKAQGKLWSGAVLNLDVHYFQRMHAPGALDRALGTELESYLVQRFGGPLGGRILYGIFLPNRGHYGTDEPAHYLETELALAF